MAYSDEVLADSPVAYWRLGETSGSYSLSTDSFTDLSNWVHRLEGDATGGSASIVSNELNLNVQCGASFTYQPRSLVEGKFALFSNFDIQVAVPDFTPSTIDTQLRLEVEIDGDDTYWIQWRNDSGDEVQNSDLQTISPNNSYGGMRLTRSSTSLQFYVKDGAGGYYAPWTAATCGTGTARVRLVASYTNSTGGARNETLTLDDFVINSGTVVSVAVDEVGGYMGLYDGSPNYNITGLLTNDSDTCIDFHGAGAEAKVGDREGFEITSAITLEAWISTDSASGTGSDSAIIGKSNAGSTGYDFLMYEDASRNIVFYLNFSSAGAQNAAIPKELITTGQTHHVVGTYDGSVFKSYLDGELITTKQYTDTITNTAGYVVTIGRYDVIGGSYFNGKIDELAVYGSALSAGDVHRHYRVGKDDFGYDAEVRALDPALYYRLDNPSVSYSLTTDTFTDYSHWTRYASGDYIQADALVYGGKGVFNLQVPTSPSSATFANLGSKFVFTGDCDFQVDVDTFNPTGNDCYLYLWILIGSTERYVCFQKNTSGTAQFCNNLSGSETATARTNTDGGLRFVRSGTTLTCHYKDGSGGSYTSWTSTTVSSSDPIAVLIRGKLGNTNTAARSELLNIDNFTVNSGSMESKVVAVGPYYRAYSSTLGRYVSTPTVNEDSLVNQANASVLLNGSSSYMTLPRDDVFMHLDGKASLTIIAWIKPTDAPTGDEYIVYFPCDDGDVGAALKLTSTGVAVEAKSVSTDSVQTKSQTYTIEADTIYQIVGVIDYANDEIDLYINGAKQGTTASVTFGNTSFTFGTLSTDSPTIGRSGIAASGYLDGGVDEIAVYTTELTATNISDIYDAGYTIPGELLQDTLSLSTSATGLGTILETLSETLNLPDTVLGGLVAGQEIQDTLSLADIPRITTKDTLVDQLTLPDTYIAQGGLRTTSLNDYLTLSEAFIGSAVRDAAVSDALVFATTLARFFPYILADTVSFADTADRVRYLVQTVKDEIVVADSEDILQIVGRTISSYLALNSPIEWGYGGDLSDTLSLSDSVTKSYLVYASLTEALILNDTASGNYLFSISVSDDLDLTDSAGAVAEVQALLDDNFSFIYLKDEQTGEFYTGYVMNTKTADITQYTNYGYNSLAKIGQSYYGANSTGLYKLEGDDDAGTEIEAKVKFGAFDFGAGRRSRVEQAYVGVRTSGKMVMHVIADDGKERWYEAQAVNSALDTQRIKLGRGVSSRYWSFELVNQNGDDFELEQIEFYPVALTRRF